MSQLRILLVDDDREALSVFGLVLKKAGYDAVGADSSASCIERLAGSGRFDLAVVDLRLGDGSGLDVITLLQARLPAIKIIMISAFAETADVVLAMRLGVAEVLDKPLTYERLLCAVRSVTAAKSAAKDLEMHAARRLACIIVRAADLPADPRTMELWGKGVSCSTGAIRNWCRTAGIKPKAALAFARVLRALTLQVCTGHEFTQLLDIADLRTLSKMLATAGITQGLARGSTVGKFLENQKFIDDQAIVSEVRRMTAGSNDS